MSETPDIRPALREDNKTLALRWFEYAHLPEDMQEISRQVYVLAEAMHAQLGTGEEKTAGMRKLLEAKDCFVRQARADRPHTQVQ
jgi:hypothetical protein